MNLRVFLNHDYNWYRAPHKYLRQQLHSFISTAGKTNFANFHSILELNDRFNNIKKLLAAHANHEDEAYHPLLEGTNLLEKVANDHQTLDQKLAGLQTQLTLMISSPDHQQTIGSGYKFNSDFLSFYSDYQFHMAHEELVVMTKMRALHGVRNLREKVTFNTYDHMSADDMIGMLKHLAQVLNFQDKSLLILDIHDSSQFHKDEKFQDVWNDIHKNNDILSASEIRELEEVL